MKNKRVVSIIMAVVLMFTLLPATPTTAKAKIKLNKKNITMTVGSTKTIKLLNNKKRVFWSIENSNIEILSETKKKVKIKAVEEGKSKVYALVGKKEYKCNIIIEGDEDYEEYYESEDDYEDDEIPSTPKPTNKPIPEPTAAPTEPPVSENKLIYKDKNVSITYTGISGEEDDYDINFLIENTSDRTFVIQVKETSINGFMVDPTCSIEVSKGKKAMDRMKIDYNDAKLIPMSKVENIETKFHIFDWDDNDFGYDTENIVIMENSSDSIKNTGNQSTATPTVEPTISPTIAPTITPEQPVVFKKDGIEVLSEYTLPDGIGWYTRHFMVIKNSSNKTVDISTSTLAYSNGMIVSAADSSFDALGAGCTSIFYEAFETSAAIDRYVMDMKVTPSEYYESVIQDLSYTQNNIDGGAIFQVTNNGKKAAEFVEGYALFFTGNTLVDYDSTYFTDDNSELKPRATISKQLNIYNNFDRIEFYLTGRRYIG